MKMNTKYTFFVEWSDEDDCYVARAPEMPLISGFGATRAEAMEEAEIACEAAIDIMIEDGIEPPAPALNSQYSGQFRLRMSPMLHKDVARLAIHRGVSLNSMVVSLVERGVGEMDTVSEITKKLLTLVERSERKILDKLEIVQQKVTDNAMSTWRSSMYIAAQDEAIQWKEQSQRNTWASPTEKEFYSNRARRAPQ